MILWCTRKRERERGKRECVFIEFGTKGIVDGSLSSSSVARNRFYSFIGHCRDSFISCVFLMFRGICCCSSFCCSHHHFACVAERWMLRSIDFIQARSRSRLFQFFGCARLFLLCVPLFIDWFVVWWFEKKYWNPRGWFGVWFGKHCLECDECMRQRWNAKR